MSMFSHLLGLDYKAPVQTKGMTDLMRESNDPTNGMGTLAQSLQSLLGNAMPQFQQNMQGQKEDNIRRGISTGDLGSSFEGDLTSAFQRNIANSLAGQASTMYNNNQNRRFALIGQQQDAEQSAQNNADQRKAGLLGGLIKGGAMLAGGY